MLSCYWCDSLLLLYLWALLALSFKNHWAAVVNLFHIAKLKVASKSHNKRSCCCRGSDMNTYEFFSPSEWQCLVSLLFSGVFTSPTVFYYKNPSVDLSAWIKQDGIVLLTQGVKINQYELWWTLCVYITHTHSCLWLFRGGSLCSSGLDTFMSVFGLWTWSFVRLVNHMWQDLFVTRCL